MVALLRRYGVEVVDATPDETRPGSRRQVPELKAAGRL